MTFIHSNYESFKLYLCFIYKILKLYFKYLSAYFAFIIH